MNKPTTTPTTANRGQDDQTGLQVSLTPIKAGLRANGEGELDVLLRVQAQARAGRTAPRTPLSIALVIDRSGSMDGAPIDAAKACAADFIQRLRGDDEVSLVVYDTEVDVLLPLMPASQARDHVHAVLSSFDARGGTDLHSGWLKGAEQLAGRTGAQRMCRVILLSDGQANRGITHERDICEQVAQLAQAGVSTTTVGLGNGFNESLMTAMATAGHGNALYGDRAQDLAEPFEAEIGLLSHLAWRDVQLRSGSATSRWKLRNGYAATGESSWSMPSIAEGSEAWGVFTVPMDSAIRAQQRSRQGKALHVTVKARSGDGELHTFTASLPALPLVDEASWAALTADPLVARRVTELKAADLKQQARDAVERGQWDQAERLLRDVEVLAADQPWVQSMVEHLRELVGRRDRARFGKEAMYSLYKMRNRLAEVDEGASFDAVMESAKPVFLRKKAVQGRGQA